MTTFKLVLVIIGLKTSIVRGECLEPAPTIDNSFSDLSGTPPFADGSSVTYTCVSGYGGEGNDTYTCVGQNWVGEFKCVKVCRYVNNIKNGRVVNTPNYRIGSWITFECDEGYKMIGDSSLLCRSSGEWRPDPPTCQIVQCGNFGEVQNGRTSHIGSGGGQNEYGSKIRITCDPDYVLAGAQTVTCRADGTWEPKPECRVSNCGSHPGLASSCIYDSVLSADGTVIGFLCMDLSENTSVTKVGKGTAVCMDDKWNDPTMACYCDCKITADFNTVITTNLQQYDFLKHNKTLLWNCKSGYRKANSADIHCNDGKLSSPAPQCIEIPATMSTTRPPGTSDKDITNSHLSTEMSTPLDGIAEKSLGLVIGLPLGVIFGIALIVGIVLLVVVYVCHIELKSCCKKKAVPVNEKSELPEGNPMLSYNSTPANV